VNRRERDKDIGYQRTLSRSRLNVITKYIDDGNPIPNSLLISLDEGAHLSKDKKFITIPNKADAGWVIDGQHRLAGAKESHTNIELLVMAFVGAGLEEQIKEFITINREAKGVPTSLYYDLLKHLPPGKTEADVAKERAADIGNTLNKDEKSLFFRRIVIDSPKRGEMSLTNFVRKVAPLVADKKGKFHTYMLSEQRGVIENYYRALEHIYPECFQNNKLVFFRTLGFGAMINALPTVFDLALREYGGFRVDDAARLLKKVEDFQFDSWETYGTGTAAETQAGEDFRLEVVRKVNADAPEGGTLRLV
jgi:DGQHR domain-containing protein